MHGSTARSSSCASAEPFDTHYQTDAQSKSGGDYELSRLNACKWQTRRETIMACMRGKCPYQFCGYEDEEFPPLGAPCPWEIIYAASLATQFDELFPADGVGRYMDDRPHHRREWTLAHLLANRAGARSRSAFNESMDAVVNRGRMPIDRRPFKAHALAQRYRTAARNRLERVWDQVPIIEQRIRDERIRTLMIAHGYWRIGDKGLPDPSAAPQWIVSKVDSGTSG